MKKLITIGGIFLLGITTTTFSGCAKPEKGETGPQGIQGSTGPSAKSITINATFNSSNSYDTYIIANDGYEQGDAVILYFVDPAFGSSDWVIQTPYTWCNGTSSPVAYFWGQLASATLFIYAQKPGYGIYTSAFSSNTTYEFKAVIIKANAMKKLKSENFDFNDYGQVMKMVNKESSVNNQ